MKRPLPGPFLVTGASGQLARRVIELLLDANAGPLIATTRDPAKLADLKVRGVDVRAADFTRPDTLASAFAGSRSFFVRRTQRTWYSLRRP